MIDSLKLIAVFALGVVLPLLSITLVIMFPVRGTRRSGTENTTTIGLGEVSLQDEFWEFIENVERGRIAPDEVAAAAIAVAERRNPDGRSGPEEPTAAA